MTDDPNVIRAEREAVALAVTMTLRPSVLDDFRLRQGVGRDLRLMTAEALMAGTLPSDVATWWAATGETLIDSLHAITAEDRASCSVFIGGALHALALAGRDRTPSDVLRAAERAVVWHRGRRWAEHHATSTPQEEVGARG